jgi:hypothetical protein
LVTQLLERLEEDRVVVVSGPAGHGKSVLGNHAVEILHRDHFSFAFRAEEFATSHLDETLHRAQVGVGAERLLALLAGQGRKLLMVESVERLLEASVRDAFSDLLALAKRDESWRIILTCRDYSIDVVRSSFLEHAGLPHALVSIPQLTDEELTQAVDAFPKLRRPATNAMLRRLFHHPYLLDKAARMQWPEDQPLPQDERSFHRKVWRELVRKDHRNVHALPQRREQAFIEIALRRARALSLFAACDDLDREAVAQLRNDDLTASTDGKSPFWDIWQVFADQVRTAGWIHQLDSRYASGAELLHKIFFKLSWKDGVRHWRRLEGFADRVDTLFENLPSCATVLDAYCRFLYTIGEKSLPHAFVVVANRLNVGDASQMLSQGTTVFYLESLLRRFIYSEPLRLKTNVKVRSAILTILDKLVDSGSSAAYRMRDDFVTPIAHQNP